MKYLLKSKESGTSMDYQRELDLLHSKIASIEKDILTKCGFIRDGKVVFDEEIYVIEIYTYERTEYESYGYTEIHKNMIAIDDDIVKH